MKINGKRETILSFFGFDLFSETLCHVIFREGTTNIMCKYIDRRVDMKVQFLDSPIVSNLSLANSCSRDRPIVDEKLT